MKTKPNSCLSVQEVESQFLIKLFLANEYFDVVTHFRSLGFVLDQFFTFEKQINLICALCHYQLRPISSLSRHLGFDFTRSLVISLVLSCLDYCNSLYCGLPSILLNKLQRFQNPCARLLFKLNRRVDVTLNLHELHCLLVGARIKFKVLMCLYCLFYADRVPNYLSDLFYKGYSHSSRRSGFLNFVQPFIRNTFGCRMFSYHGAVL